MAFSRIINLPSFYFQLQAFNFNVELSSLCCLSRVLLPLASSPKRFNTFSETSVFAILRFFKGFQITLTAFLVCVK